MFAAMWGMYEEGAYADEPDAGWEVREVRGRLVGGLWEFRGRFVGDLRDVYHVRVGARDGVKMRVNMAGKLCYFA